MVQMLCGVLMGSVILLMRFRRGGDLLGHFKTLPTTAVRVGRGGDHSFGTGGLLLALMMGRLALFTP